MSCESVLTTYQRYFRENKRLLWNIIFFSNKYANPGQTTNMVYEFYYLVTPFLYEHTFGEKITFYNTVYAFVYKNIFDSL